MNHTPGPWHIADRIERAGYGFDSGPDYAYISAEKGWQAFARVVVLGAENSPRFMREEGEANARLIAAAPSMAYELEKALACLRSPDSFDVEAVCSHLEAVLRLAGVR